MLISKWKCLCAEGQTRLTVMLVILWFSLCNPSSLAFNSLSFWLPNYGFASETLVQSFPNMVSGRLWEKKPNFSGLQVSGDEHVASGAKQRGTSSFCIASWKLSLHGRLWVCPKRVREDHPCENRQRLFTQSWLQQGRRPPHHLVGQRLKAKQRSGKASCWKKKEGFRHALAGGGN